MILDLPSGARYHVDPSFGGDGPTNPLPLVSGQTIRNLGSQEVRLVKGRLPQQSRGNQEHWMYQYRNGPDKQWNSFYCFHELEWFPADFEIINRFTSWEVLDRGTVIAVKFIRNGEEGEAMHYQSEDDRSHSDDEVYIVGKVMLVDNLLKLNMGGRTRVIQTVESKDHRSQLLEKWFSPPV